MLPVMLVFLHYILVLILASFVFSFDISTSFLVVPLFESPSPYDEVLCETLASPKRMKGCGELGRICSLWLQSLALHV